MYKKIQNPVARCWNDLTLEAVVNQLKELDGIEIMKDDITCVCTLVSISGNREEVLCSIKGDGTWLTRYNGELLVEA